MKLLQYSKIRQNDLNKEEEIHFHERKFVKVMLKALKDKFKFDDYFVKTMHTSIYCTSMYCCYEYVNFT